MAKKTYRTYFLKGYQLLLTTKDGNRAEIKFRGGIQVDSTSKFTTSNEELQELLETASGFGRDYYIESVIEDAPQAPEKPAEKKSEKKAEPVKEIMEEVKGMERFRNLVEMKNRMAELGIELDEDANYQKAKAAAAKAGYDFQINRK